MIGTLLAFAISWALAREVVRQMAAWPPRVSDATFIGDSRARKTIRSASD